MRDLKLLTKYRHFCGDEYMVLCISSPTDYIPSMCFDFIECWNTENLEKMIVCKTENAWFNNKKNKSFEK